MSEEPKNRPTHELKLLDVDSGDTSLVGVAWAKENGTISVKLNPGVVLSYDNLKGKYLTLFKTRTKEEWDAFHAERRRQQEQPRSAPGYDGNGGNWKKNHPEYVRKVHFTAATKKDCSSRWRGLPQLSDDPAKITCTLCKSAFSAAPASSDQSNPPPTTPAA
jgi:hypothetical protein